MDSDDQDLASAVQQLRDVRHSLLHLHKALLDCEREAYERAHGRIENAYEVLQLVMHDPWFAWLHRLSGLVVQMDETLDADEPLGEGNITALIKQARTLLMPSEVADEFQRKYLKSLQTCPDAVLAHAVAVKLLGRGKAEDETKSPAAPTA